MILFRWYRFEFEYYFFHPTMCRKQVWSNAIFALILMLPYHFAFFFVCKEQHIFYAFYSLTWKIIVHRKEKCDHFLYIFATFYCGIYDILFTLILFLFHHPPIELLVLLYRIVSIFVVNVANNKLYGRS